MKLLFKGILNGLLLAALLAGILPSCGGNRQQADSVDSAQAANDTAAVVDSESAGFAVKAADGGMMEVKLGDLAQNNAGSQRVKDFGNMMVRDHSRANDELKGLAVTKNITLPDSVSDDHKKHIEKLGKKTGVEFDRAYIDMMVDDHEKDVDEFRKASNNLVDPDLKSFANNTLPTLQAHLDSAKAIQETLKKQMNVSDRPPIK